MDEVWNVDHQTSRAEDGLDLVGLAANHLPPAGNTDRLHPPRLLSKFGIITIS